MAQIQVSNVSKGYKTYASRGKRLLQWLLPWYKAPHETTWVLRDINFIIQPGESVGIVGVNGAGKSTLLKIITGTTQPTTGGVQLHGRVAALLELGMGFHPDFTGRQNVFMAGQLMGISHKQLSELMPEIEAFAEIGDYIDKPVRVYSSGMQMRLAFSVATAIRPDVLIVDEALSVGDAYFQHKSFNKIREFREQGTSLLIVSHDRSAIQTLCDRAILLEAGFVIKDGQPEEVMDFYNALIAEKENAAPTIQVQRLPDGRAQTSSGTGEAKLLDIQLLNSNRQPVEAINVGEQVVLQAQVQVNQDLPELVFGYMLKDRLGQQVFGTNTHHLGIEMSGLKAGQVLTLEFAFPANLGIGSYSVTTALHISDSHVTANYEWRDLALVFNVININHSPFVGVNWMPPQAELIYE